MNNSEGGTGIAPDVQIVPARVLGKCGGYTSDVADAMRWAAGIAVSGTPVNTKPAHVLNLSLGGSGSCSNTFQQAVADVLAQGKTIVAAAGNDGAIGISQPANCPGVLAVTAHAIDGDNADYSNIGAATAISAPGGGCGTLTSSCVPNSSANGLGVISTHKTGGSTPATAYASKYGTSMATPHVTAVAALMLQQNLGLSAAEVKSYLHSSAANHPEGTLCRQSRYLGLCGEGMLDADVALQKVINVAPTLSLDDAYQIVAPGAPVTLSGRGQADSSYVWSQSYGSDVGLSVTTATAGVATAYFTAPASGIYTFQLEASRSGQFGKATATVRVNSAPRLTASSDQSVAAGSGLTFSVGASDGDGDPFTFHAISLPVGASLSTGGTFNWSSAMPVGTHTLSYYAMDDAGTQSSIGTVEIVVNSVGGGSGGGGGSLDWLSLLVLSMLAVPWRWQRRRQP
jgi:serine protease